MGNILRLNPRRILILLVVLPHAIPLVRAAGGSESITVNAIDLPTAAVRGLSNPARFNVTNGGSTGQLCVVRFSGEGFNASNHTVSLQVGANVFNLSFTPLPDLTVGFHDLTMQVEATSGSLVYHETRTVRVVGRLEPAVHFSPGETVSQGQPVTIAAEVEDELGESVGNATVWVEIGSNTYNFTERQPGFQTTDPIDTNGLAMGNLTVTVRATHENYTPHAGNYPLLITRDLHLDDHGQFPATLYQGTPTTIKLDLVDGYSNEPVQMATVTLEVGGGTFTFTEVDAGGYLAVVNVTSILGPYTAYARGSKGYFRDAERSYSVTVRGVLRVDVTEPETEGRIVLSQGSRLMVAANVTVSVGVPVGDASVEARVAGNRFIGSRKEGGIYTVSIDTSGLRGSHQITVLAGQMYCDNVAARSISVTIIPSELLAANTTVLSIKSAGYNVTLAEEALRTAYEHALRGEVDAALRYSSAAVSLAQGSRDATIYIDLAREAIAKARLEGRTVGLDQAQTLLSTAEGLYRTGDYSTAIAYARRARQSADEAVSPATWITRTVLPLAILTSAVTAFAGYRRRRRGHGPPRRWRR